MPAPAVFRRRSRRGLAISSAANVASPAYFACGRHDGRLTRGSRLGGATWSSFGSHRDEWRWEPLPLDDAPGVLALRSFHPACRSDECFHPPAPTCRSPERPSRSLRFSNSGRSAAFLSSVGPKHGPAARQKNLYGTADHEHSGSAPGFALAGKPCRAGHCARRGAILPWALPLAGMRTPAGVHAPPRRETRRQPRDEASYAMCVAKLFRFRVLTLTSFGGHSVS